MRENLRGVGAVLMGVVSVVVVAAILFALGSIVVFSFELVTGPCDLCGVTREAP